jgi:hypothetical protein
MYVQQEVFGFLVENDAMLDASFKGIFLWDPAANGGLGAYSAVGARKKDRRIWPRDRDFLLKLLLRVMFLLPNKCRFTKPLLRLNQQQFQGLQLY